MAFHDAGHGYDVFGLHPPSVDRLLGATRFLYDHYFRVESEGSQHIPLKGPVLLVANHGGVLPIDALMLWSDLVQRSGRTPRIIEDRFVPRLPWFGAWFARLGGVGGSRENLTRLLAMGELTVIFPEGTRGTGKTFFGGERYRMQRWAEGPVEFALRYEVPIVPVAIVGAEDAWPLGRKLPGLLGLPYWPVPISPLPLPIKMYIRYGAPLRLGHAPATADDPATVAAQTHAVRLAVADLVTSTLRSRREALARTLLGRES